MHSLDHNGFSMHFNSDLSGDVTVSKGDKDLAKIPGELIRSYIRKYVLGRLRDEFSDLLYRQLTEYGGKNTADRLLLERFDNITAVSTTQDPTAVLHGTAYLLGSMAHITFVRVTPEGQNNQWVAVDRAFQDELDNVELVAGSQGRLEAIDVPGYQGKYIAYTYPHAE